MARNVLGGELQPCSYDPLTGYFRDGCCNTREDDVGTHVICVKVTADFLRYSKQRGNDLVTPRPDHRFRGLKPGDRWCLCATRWVQAHEAGVAPPVVLESTHERALDHATIETLKRFALVATQRGEQGNDPQAGEDNKGRSGGRNKDQDKGLG